MLCLNTLVLMLCLIVKADPGDQSETTTESFIESNRNAAIISSGGQEIKAELDTCTLKIGITNPKSSLLAVERAQKGERGDLGSKGDVGPQGIKGDKGEDGKEGKTGAQGEKGDTGKKGEKGETGERGYAGISGPPGTQGSQGQKGEPGEKCKNTADSVSQAESGSDLTGVTLSHPAKTCTDIDTTDDGLYYLNPSEPFMAICDFTNKQVCLQKEKLNQTEKLMFIGDQFLLSENGFVVKDLYGITLTQLAFLNSWTVGGRQTIKYYCDKTLVYSEGNLEKSLQLLMWNDNLVGPSRTPDTPVYYRVLNTTCNDSKVGGYAYIEISAQTNNRLPVVDFYIRDKRTDAAISLHLMDLCLNFVD